MYLWQRVPHPDILEHNVIGGYHGGEAVRKSHLACLTAQAVQDGERAATGDGAIQLQAHAQSAGGAETQGPDHRAIDEESHLGSRLDTLSHIMADGESATARLGVKLRLNSLRKVHPTNGDVRQRHHLRRGARGAERKSRKKEAYKYRYMEKHYQDAK